MNQLEQFNEHQEGTKRRLEFWAKSIFLIAGAGLTLSANLFLGKEAPDLSNCLAGVLQLGWGALFMSIVTGMLSVSVMMIRDYLFGERWRRHLQGRLENVTGSPGILDALIWIFGVFSLVCLLGGLGALGWVSISLVGVRG